MNATVQQTHEARAILDAELALLKAKVSNGSTLRAAERRHLLSLTGRVDVRGVALATLEAFFAEHLPRAQREALEVEGLLVVDSICERFNAAGGVS